jgi:hypothetical protein
MWGKLGRSPPVLSMETCTVNYSTLRTIATSSTARALSPLVRVHSADLISSTCTRWSIGVAFRISFSTGRFTRFANEPPVGCIEVHGAV